MQSAHPLPAGQPLLVADKVNKIYRSGDVEVPALIDLDLTVGVGELVAVMGPSGSGKTTLLNCLSGLDDIDAGHVRVAGRDLFSMSDADRTEHRARSMGFVFQSFNLIPTLTAQENVETALEPLGVPAEERRRRAAAALESVGLADRANHVPGELSGGQQQRVAIARALVKEPDVLLADEPTGNLDEQTRDEIMDLLEAIRRDRGLTLVIVTHDSAVARRAQRRLILRNGTVSERP
jgi:putative ABC transport system ATP-binding protein